MTQIANLCQETTTGTGTGNLTLSAAAGGKQRFSDAFGTGGTNTFFYFISHRAAAEWEVGTGHMSDASTLVRDTVLASSNGNAAVNFSAGTKDVVNDIPAARQAILSASGLLPLVQGGTNAATASEARTNLGLAIGTDVQAYDAQLADIAGLAVTKGNIIAGNGTNFAALGVGTNGQVLTADSAEATGLKWATAAGGSGGDYVRLSGPNTFTSVADVDFALPSGYDYFDIFLEVTSASANYSLLARASTDNVTYDTSGYLTQFTGSRSTTLLSSGSTSGGNFFDGYSFDDTSGIFTARIQIIRPRDSGVKTAVHAVKAGINAGSTNTQNLLQCYGIFDTARDDAYFRLTTNAATTMTGRYTLYGVKTS